MDNTLRNKEVASRFLGALKNSKARDFVKAYFAQFYADAILNNQPHAKDVEEKCKILIEKIISAFDEIDPSLVFEKAVSLDIWPLEFVSAYERYKKESKLPLMSSFLLPYIERGTSLIDIGCGNGNLIRHIAHLLYNVKVAGTDVIDWRSELVKKENAFKFFKMGQPVDEKYDIGILFEVIHHAAGTEEAAISFLKELKDLVKEKLLIVEDVFFESEDFEKACPWHLSLAKSRQNRSFNAYCSLSPEEQKSYCIILDTISNILAMGISEMALPYGFHSINKWHKILNKSGWEIVKTEIIGFVPKLFHRPSMALFVCTSTDNHKQ